MNEIDHFKDFIFYSANIYLVGFSYILYIVTEDSASCVSVTARISIFLVQIKSAEVARCRHIRHQPSISLLAKARH
jgi:hypothetical protein